MCNNKMRKYDWNDLEGLEDLEM